MKINSGARLLLTVLVAVLGVPIAANWQAVSDRMGWSTAIADKVMPKVGPSPLTHFVTSPLFLASFLIIVGIAAGAWLDTVFRAIDNRRASKRWWVGLHSFSIRDAACLMAGVYPPKFESSPRAMGIANELKGLVDSGHMPKVLEREAKRPASGGGMAAVLEAYALHPPYDPKDVPYDAVIRKTEVESFARGRGHSLPWPNVSPNDRIIPMLDGSKKTYGELTSGIKPLEGTGK